MNSENAVELRNIEMHFNMSKEKLESLKEYFLKFMKRQLYFEDFVALDNISFDIKKGDVFGIVGLNGCGKSTTLKVISGILKPTKGTVETCGLQPSQGTQTRRCRIREAEAFPGAVRLCRTHHLECNHRPCCWRSPAVDCSA